MIVGGLVFVTGAAPSLSGQRAAESGPAAPALPSFAEPAISPDGTELAVVSGGDIWTVPAAGGEARLLVAHEADESRPVYSPDGTRLAFVSDRTGNGDIYLLNLSSGGLSRLTDDAGSERLDGWSRDGEWVYFSSNSRDISGMNNLYRVRARGGTPMRVSADRDTSAFFAAPSPDGTRVAFSARGNGASQWWRNGQSHLDESELWLLHDGVPPRYEPLTKRGAKQLWPMWSADGRRLYYVSDRSGVQNIWTLEVGESGAAQRRGTALPVYTGSRTLVDGSSMRMPSTRITTADGVDMELNPRPVDIPVSRPIGESLAGKDSQLDAAVRELLTQLGTTTNTSEGGR